MELRRLLREGAGALGDLGVLVPIAVALVVVNGLSATAVLLPAGLLYVAAGLAYRLPVPVQPLKAFGALAVALGLGPDEVAAGAMLLGGVFLVLGLAGALGAAARWVPLPVVRGVQLSVGLLFLRIAWDLVTDPPAVFTDAGRPGWWLVGGAAAVAVLSVLARRHLITLLWVLLATGAVLWHGADLRPGPAPLTTPALSAEVWVTAATALVLPQLPLTFANSCLATADVARRYFGAAASRVTPDRLAVSLGLTNLLAGAISGMPVCHGAGGMTAHRYFGARSGLAPVLLGSALLALALLAGASLAGLLAAFPLPVLAGLLAVAGLAHIGLVRDVRGRRSWLVVLVVAAAGVLGQLALGLLAGVALAAALGLSRRREPSLVG
ncbi:putative sulfate/molybdate transporter [Ornithinicoccus halotolerans]|uniref:putative sulfate/molybdate transporter n=1 Tax=Ornithinicoccus halotolerans TaxID=1748220 RepID=UPI0012974DAF|nr:putative sulfate/molybdate transporter [Ornithinicoccus halotolerans]